LKILLFLESVPEKHKLSPALAKLLDIHSDTLSNVIMGIWRYAKTHKLQDADDRRVLVCDEKLQQVFSLIHQPSLPSMSPI
jgi:SWI/SNF-related matrix-associated actin-dependent regulator of chromatin subfamily D